MLRPSGSNPYEAALIEKIRETTETIAREDQISKHPERFVGDPRAAAVLARVAFQANLRPKPSAGNLTFTAPARKRA